MCSRLYLFLLIVGLGYSILLAWDIFCVGQFTAIPVALHWLGVTSTASWVMAVPDYVRGYLGRQHEPLPTVTRS